MKLYSAALICSAWAVVPLALAQQEQQPLTAEESVLDMPLLGFGTWNLDKSNASEAVSLAIQTGYRHIDTAAIYGDEVEVGRGIADGLLKTGLLRSDIWVTSKLWNDHHAPEDVPKALNKTLADLDLDYLDLYLIHWPVASSGKNNTISYMPTWQAMNALPKTHVRNVGVSNFSPSQVKDLLQLAKPYAHQMELHPYLPQTSWVSWHYEHDIRVTAYSPLGDTNPTYDGSEEIEKHHKKHKKHKKHQLPRLLSNPAVLKIAKKNGCTPAQVVLRWGFERETAVIPKSQRADRIVENFGMLTECPLERKDFKALDKLPVKRFNNPSEGWGVDLFEGLQDVE